MNTSPDYSKTQTVCPLHDGQNCALLVNVQNGRITKITPGHFPGQVYKGACIKGLFSHRWIYHNEGNYQAVKRIYGREEGIEIMALKSPTRILGENARGKRLECV